MHIPLNERSNNVDNVDANLTLGLWTAASTVTREMLVVNVDDPT